MAIDKLTLNGTDIQTTCGFYLNWRRLSAPEPQIEMVAIPGSDRAVDLTETFGDVYYNQRTIEMGMTHPSDSWIADYDYMLANFHGKICTIVFNNDPNWYWSGRVIISEYDSKTHKLSMVATVFPYKLASALTTVSKTVSGVTQQNAQTVTLTKSRLKLSPKVTVVTADDSDYVTIRWSVGSGTATKAMSAGTYYIKGLKVGSSDVTIDVWGTGTITFEYRKGTL